MKELVEELIRIKEGGAAAVLATVIEVERNGGVEPGEKWLIRDGRIKVGTIRHEGLAQAILKEAGIRLKEESSKLVPLDLPDTGGKVEVFFEVRKLVLHERVELRRIVQLRQAAPVFLVFGYLWHVEQSCEGLM